MISPHREIPGWIVLLGLVIVLVPAGVLAAQPMTPLMTTLLSVFPEENGWFVEGPLGVTPFMPEDARKFFDQPRVIAPDIDALQIAVGKLFAASGQLRIKKITRYDEKPGADGLPGFRGIWCQAEDKDAVGFSILTPNQNRFLLWAKDQYYPAFGVDTIEGKIRDWYARSVSEHLASIDYNVPDSGIPVAAERSLPVWMELYPAAPPMVIQDALKFEEFLAASSEIKIWGWEGLAAFIPTASAINRFIASAEDTLYPNRNAVLLQGDLRSFHAAGGKQAAINALTEAALDTLSSGNYAFAVDRYGRIRIARWPGEKAAGDAPTEQAVSAPPISHALLFPGAAVLTAGTIELGRLGNRPAVKLVTTRSEPYFYSRIAPSIREDITDASNSYLLSLGHLFSSLKAMDVALDSVLIRKF